MSAGSPSIRVKIDLKDACPTSKLKFPLSWMHIDVSQVTTVKRLCKSIKRRHALSGKYHLFLEDGVLPPDEGIRILRDNDTLTVTRESRDDDASSNSSTEPRARKRKRHESHGSCTAEENGPALDGDANHISESGARTGNKGSASPWRKKSVSIPVEEQSRKNLSSNAAEEKQGSEEPLQTTLNGEQRARRKRIRKHKKRKRTLSPSKATVEPPVPAFQQSTPVASTAEVRHKFFDNTDEEDVRQCPPPAAHGSCGVLTQHLLPADDGTGPLAQESDTSESSEEDEVVAMPPAASTSSQSTMPLKAREAAQTSTEGTEEDEAPPYETLPPVRVPRVGDRIAFKVLEMDEHYNPQESCYREGEVISYNAKSGQVSLHLQHPIPDPSMFVPMTDDGEGPTLVHRVSYNWSHLLSPVLVEQKESGDKT